MIDKFARHVMTRPDYILPLMIKTIYKYILHSPSNLTNFQNTPNTAFPFIINFETTIIASRKITSFKTTDTPSP